MRHLQAESGVWQKIFLHVIPVRFIVAWCNAASQEARGNQKGTHDFFLFKYLLNNLFLFVFV